MPRFAANLSMMFQELPFLERFGAAAAAGFRGVEYLFPYEYKANAIAEQLKKYRLENVLFNMPPGRWAEGERGIACLPDRREEFRAGVAKAIEYAVCLGTTRLHAMAGIASREASEEDTREIYLDNLRYAAAECSKHDITLLVEAINTRDIPGFYLSTQSQAYAVVEGVDAPNLKMQMDCYHMQIMEGDLDVKLRRYAHACGHVQIAGVPSRHEPDCGEVNYPYLFDLLDDLPYDGWVGCEYKPAGPTMEGLGWFKRSMTGTEGREP